MFNKVIAFLLLLMMPFTAYAGWHVIGTAVVVVRENSHLNGRAKPVNGFIEMKLYQGDTVEIVSYGKDGWVEIIGGETGTVWVKDTFLADEWYELDAPKTYRVCSNGRVRIRTLPGGKGIAGWAEDGEVVTVSALAVKDGATWAKTPEGYVMTVFLKEVEG